MDTTPAGDILVGPLNRPLRRLAWPLAVGYLGQIGFNWVDMALVGRVGPDSLAAVGGTMYAIWCMIAFAELASAGTLALVARAVGARDPQRAGAAALTGLLFGAALTAAVAALGGQIPRWVVGIVNFEPAPAALGVDYLEVLCFGFPTLGGFLLLESIFRGAGETRLPMLVLAGSFALNAVLDVVLIFGLGPVPALGVQGAALATVGARGAGLLVLSAFLWRRRAALGLGRPRPGELSLRRALEIARIGAPVSAAGIAFSTIYLGLARITEGLGGTPAVAALGVGIRMESVSYMLMLAIGRAAGTIAGQNLGAVQPERARDAVRLALRWAVLCMLPITALLLAWPSGCMRIMTDDAAVIAEGSLYLRVVALALIPMAYEIVLDNVAGGVGDTAPAMAIVVVGTVIRIPLALGLAALGWGTLAVWYTISATMVLKGVAFWVWFRRERWLRTGLEGEPLAS
ncbi:MAG: MATE family efflux transporter [Planctomycetes bacterium]|nr:MATE family efflux transporter [Planctomycetota bacterium]